MELEKLCPLEETEFVKIDGKRYLINPDLEKISRRIRYLPLYFAVSKVTHIAHDSPIIGVYRTGFPSKAKIYGPFKNEEEAERKARNVTKKRKKELNPIDYDFHEYVVTKIFPESEVEKGINLFKYFLSGMGLGSESSFYIRTYEERMRYYQRLFDLEIHKLMQNADKIDQKNIENRFFSGLELVTVNEDEKRSSFNVLRLNRKEQRCNSPPFADQNNEFYLNQYFYPSLQINSILDYELDKTNAEILLSQPINFLETFDSGCRSIWDLLELNKDKILIK